jgi:hypothetical protein
MPHWNDIDGKTKSTWVINLPQYCCFPHEPHTDWPGLGSKLAISGESGDWAVAEPNCVDDLVPFIYGYEAEFFFM